MIKRLLAIRNRQADDDEKVKSLFTWIMLILAGAGAFGVYSWASYWLNGQPLYMLSESQLYAVNVCTLVAFIFTALTAVSLRSVRSNYREALYLKEVEKGYHAPYMELYGADEGQASNEEEMYDFIVGLGTPEHTIFAPMPMYESQIVNTLESISLTPNQVTSYQREYKSSKLISDYLKKRKVRANREYLQSIPERIPVGQAVGFPVD